MKKKFTEKQIAILNVAEELISEKGFERTSVRDISSKANINVAMISYYFGSKDRMLSYLYQYRVQRTKQSFKEFTEMIKEGKPEMQMKEILKFIVGQMFKYNYFHGFVKQEMRQTEVLKDELTGFYKTAVGKIDEVVKRGVSSGVFHHAPRSEDILSQVIGSAVFAIRNKNFYEDYIPNVTEENYLKAAEEKVRGSVYQSIFSLLGYRAES